MMPRIITGTGVPKANTLRPKNKKVKMDRRLHSSHHHHQLQTPMLLDSDTKQLIANPIPIPSQGLPKGWRREENVRQSGLSAGRVDVYYVSPEGRKYWTKTQLARHFGDTVDLTNFDFHSGLFITGGNRKASTISLLKKPKVVGAEYTKSTKTDTSLSTPIRQTASIFKQPVTIIKTQKSRVKADFKHGVQECPRQLFWEKRLQGLTACDPSGRPLPTSELPPGIIPAGPGIDKVAVLHSIATAFHLGVVPLTGQTANRENLLENPGVFINPEQPLFYEAAISEDDIRVQEDKVIVARKNLEETLRKFYPGSITRLRARSEYTGDTEEIPVEAIPEDIKGKPSITPIQPNSLKHSTNLNPHKKLRLNQNHERHHSSHYGTHVRHHQ